jgi:hypothetical protein
VSTYENVLEDPSVVPAEKAALDRLPKSDSSLGFVAELYRISLQASKQVIEVISERGSSQESRLFALE